MHLYHLGPPSSHPNSPCKFMFSSLVFLHTHTPLYIYILPTKFIYLLFVLGGREVVETESDRVLLCSLGWPGTHCINQTDLDLPVSPSQVLL